MAFSLSFHWEFVIGEMVMVDNYLRVYHPVKSIAHSD